MVAPHHKSIRTEYLCAQRHQPSRFKLWSLSNDLFSFSLTRDEDIEDIFHHLTCMDEQMDRKIKGSFASSTHGIHCSLLIHYLLSLSSEVNVPCLSNKNSLERQLPQVKLCSFPDSSLPSISIEILPIYFRKLKQLLLCPP